MNPSNAESSPQSPDQPLPGSVSNQNGEEAEPGHGQGTAPAGGQTPREQEPSRGESSEGSQSTGDPNSAG